MKNKMKSLKNTYPIIGVTNDIIFDGKLHDL